MTPAARDDARQSERAAVARRLVFAVALGLLGFALNRISVPILGDETPEFVFGGAPVLLVFGVLGPRYGMLAGLLSLLPMLSRFDPAGYASVVYLVEFVCVWWLYPRVHGFAPASVVFWAVLGWLLDAGLYGWGVGLSGDYLTLLFYKQILNGAFNGIVADGLLMGAARWLHACAGQPLPRPTPLLAFAVRLALAGVLVPVLAGTIAATRESYAHSVTQAHDEADAVATRVAGTIRQSFEAREIDVMLLSRDLDRTQAAGAAGIGGILSRFAAEHPGFINIDVTDADGTILAATPETTALGTRLAGRNVAERSYFSEARDRRSLVWAPLVLGSLHVRARTTPEPIMIVAAPLFDARGAFRGVLFGAVDVLAVFSSVVPAREPGPTRITVFDSIGQVVYADSPGRRVGAALALPVDVGVGEQAETRRFSYHPEDGPTALQSLKLNRMFAVTQPVRRGGLAVLVDMPASWVHARMRSVTVHALLWFTLFFGFAAGLMLWGAGVVTRRLVAWQTAIDDVAHRRVIAPGVLQRGVQSRLAEVRALSDALTIMDEAVRSEREHAQATLANSEERLRANADHTSAVIFMKDLEGRYLLVNRQFEMVVRLPAAAILGKTHRDLFPSETAERFTLYEQTVVRTGQVIEIEQPIPLEDGVHPYVVTMFPLRTESGDIYALGAIAVDHTERQREATQRAALEAQNQQLQRSESLGRMAGAIAHSFNNQLAAVMGNLELALEGPPGHVDSAQNLTEALSAARRAAEVSTLMLTYLGQRRGVRARIDLAEVSGRCIPVLEAVIPKHVTLETAMQVPGPAVNADESQLQQVLSNLVSNACEAMGEEPGVVRVDVARVTVGDIPSLHRFPLDWQPQAQAYARLSVTDHGCGIAHTDIERVFDPFFTSKFTGRGMGLSVVLGIVRAHGGAVSVESELGRGSVFRVYLPISPESAAPSPDGPDAGVPSHWPASGVTVDERAAVRNTTGGGTVLLVDDEPAVRRVAASMLTRLGYSVVQAEDGPDAVETFRRHRDTVQCVVCDLTMPGMSGWDTLAALRQIEPAIPAVLASGYDEASVMGGEHAVRPDAFLAKPFQLKGLRAALEKALDAGSSLA